MTPESFIAKWSPNARSERASAQEHFVDLCRLLDEPTPNEADPSGRDYAFEKGVTKSGSGRGFADVWRRDRFALEYKKKGADLSAAFVQLQRYSLALDNPPLLVVSDIDSIVIRTAWTNTVSETITVRLADLADPARRRTLKHMMSDPDKLKPQKTRQKLTEEAAEEFAKLAQTLRDRGHDPQEAAHFINRLVFCLFADHAGLLPDGLLQKFLTFAGRRPERFKELAGRLFAALSKPGGEWDMTAIPWFNGGLFNDDASLPLRAEDVRRLQAVRSLDWADIDVSIFGTLFERGLDPGKRSQLGAHYTDRDKIMLIIDPVIVRPLRAEWAEARGRIEAALAEGAADRPAAARARARDAAKAAAQAIYLAFQDRIAAFRVLDPACGSGNFLFLAVQALQDIEHLAGIEAEALGLQRSLPRVGPEAVLGIDVNPFAAELARVSVWIGHLQWARRNSMPMRSEPLLRPLDTIECRDAVLAPDGTPAAWPEADVIVGNPPFLGDKLMRRTMGDAEVEGLRAAYDGRLPAGADLVCYWFEAARKVVLGGGAARAGLVATNSIRGGANRHVLDAISRDATIFEAWSDEPWTVDGAAVRVSIACWQSCATAAATLDGAPVQAVRPDLTAGGANLISARRLPQNVHIAFMGDTKGGAFDVSGTIARRWLDLPSNANGRPNSDVLRPWANGLDVTRRPLDTWIIDFGYVMPEAEAKFYAAPYGHVASHVKPQTYGKRAAYTRTWWRHTRPRPEMKQALAGLRRFIATPTVAKHRVLVWMPATTLPDHHLIAIARDGDTTFGILHSRFHESWSLRLGTSLEDRPRYTPTTTFETFPFPEGLTPDTPAASYADDPRAQAVAAAAVRLVEARDRWLNPGDLAERVPDVLPHLPHRIVPRDAAAAAKLKSRTLTNLYNTRGKPEGAWLDALHADLDAAVAAAYGWPADISEADALAALLALNVERSSASAARP